MASQDDEFLTVAEIAAILKLNQQTVRNWIDAGTLPAIRVGRRVRIRRSDFDKLVEGGATVVEQFDSSEGTITGEQFWDGQVPAPVVPASEQE